MIEVEGSRGEGGGQILRTAVALAALTGNDLRVKNIRAGRPRPGLAAQHLAALKGVASICAGELDGAILGSTEIEFRPGTVQGGKHVIDVGTAGSITLVAQAALLALSHCREEFELMITGGTDVPLAPPISYLEMIVLPQLRRMGYEIGLLEMRRGFYPPGGGMAHFSGTGTATLRPVRLENRGRFNGIDGIAFAQNLPEHVTQKLAMESKRLLVDHRPVSIGVENGQGPSPGAGLVLRAKYENTVLGSSALGERGVPAEKVAAKAVAELRQEMSGSTLDRYASDQLLPYMALCDEESVFLVDEVSSHLSTQIELLPLFLPVRIETAQDLNKMVRVRTSRT